MSDKKRWAVVCQANGPNPPLYRTGNYRTARAAQEMADKFNSGEIGHCPEHHSVEERK